MSNHLLYVGAFGLSVVAVQAVAIIIIAVLILTFTDYSAVKLFFYLNSYSHCNNRAERKSREEIKHTIVNSE